MICTSVGPGLPSGQQTRHRSLMLPCPLRRPFRASSRLWGRDRSRRGPWPHRSSLRDAVRAKPKKAATLPPEGLRSLVREADDQHASDRLRPPKPSVNAASALRQAYVLVLVEPLSGKGGSAIGSAFEHRRGMKAPCQLRSATRAVGNLWRHGSVGSGAPLSRAPSTSRR